MPKKSSQEALAVSAERIESSICRIRGLNVLLDFQLAELYDVPTKRLNEQVSRNRDRFPEDFMFRLNKDELEHWRSHFATSNPAVKMSLRRPPRAFTEQGVAMLSSVLRSDRAIQVNIAIMRTFVRLRGLVAAQEELHRKVRQLEQQLDVHDDSIAIIFRALRALMPSSSAERPSIGFQPEVLGEPPEPEGEGT